MDWNGGEALLALLFLLFFWSLWRRGRRRPYMKLTKVGDFQGREAFGARLPERLKVGALVLFLVGFSDPSVPFLRDKVEIPRQPPREGIALYFAIDQSSSMAGEIVTFDEKGRSVLLPKLERVKQLTRDFVQGDPARGLMGRRDDLLGLVGFARTAEVKTPLTLDHQALLEQLQELSLKEKPEEDGTALGYALFKTAHLIAATRYFAEQSSGGKDPSYEIVSSALVVLTDGFQDANPLDQDNRYRSIDPIEAAAYAKEKGIRVYIVNVDPRIAEATYSSHRKLLEQAANLTGGRFFFVEKTGELERVYQEIDQLEKSAFEREEAPLSFRRFSLSPYFIAVGMVALFLSILLETIWMRRVP